MPHVHAPQVHAAAMHVPKLAAGLDKYGGRERHSHDASDYMRRVPRPRARWTVIFAAVGLGALVMYFFDLQSGRRRRALLRDKLAHARNVATRRLPRTIRRRRRFLGGVARGIGHEAAGVVLRDDHHVIVDDDTLVARVRSEVLRSDRWKSGEIHLDAYEGCVTLRGQLEHESEIRKLIEETQRVEGVREVRSYLHLPGTLPPNKAEVYELERVPSHMAAQE